MTDEQLLSTFLARRDGSAFESLLRRYGPMVFRVSRDILGDVDDAEDAFQATFLVLFRQAGSIREPGSVGRWLYEVACRISRRELRRLARLRSQERQAPSMDEAAFSDFDPAGLEMKPILHDEIRRLPSKLRDPIILCYFEGLSVEEVASRLRCPLGTLKSRLAKGREVLRSRLTRRGLAASVLLLLMFSMTEEVTADVAEPLIESTVEAGFAGADLGGISGKVASMVIEEESRRRWSMLVSSWAALFVLLVLFGTARMMSGPKAEASVETLAEPSVERLAGLPPRSGVPSAFLQEAEPMLKKAEAGKGCRTLLIER